MPVYHFENPVRTLISSFFAWKALLFTIAIGSGLGPAYDTSSTLISADTPSSDESLFDIATRLTRWDAIYFVQASRRGYLYEQEWAFGSGLPTVISFFTKVLESFGVKSEGSLEPLVGIVVANASHLLSVLVLYQLGLVVWKSPRMSCTAALLHVLSPAGVFLSAPYSESTFSLLSFMGYLFFCKAILSEKRAIAHDVSLVASGLWFGFAATFRSNGILNGIPFAVELFRELSVAPTFTSIRRRLALIVAGSTVAVGFVLPQIVAYQTFCSGSSAATARPWCTSSLPSIYSFVQEHYWNVGFLRYWTPGNIPLFLLATPMLYILMKSGLEVFRRPSSLAIEKGNPDATPNRVAVLRSMAASQLILTALAITNYHIQIITRISSGYPVWYWWLAGLLGNHSTARLGGNIVVFMIMYAGIQGALFASFLPPA
ncbi:GPI mannosyltransferase 2 [Biscogniauxia mediterranea]|nr:GPI mannosyltransferase 2 [Biscogniauxia mediterranea]